jgi:glutamyl-tRNA synthetase
MPNSNVRVRFAPSPTGKMHVGHLRAAIPNALYAKKHGGSFILRFEDTDIERQVEASETLFLGDMKWLGLVPDESIEHGGNVGPYNTLARHERGDYKEAVQKLLDMGRAYECFTSPEELDLMRKLQRARGEPPRYDNRHRDLSEAEKEKFRAQGRQPVIRFKLEDGEINFTDLVRGEQTFLAEKLGGDPVIVRSNGIPLFTLGGVVDDINMGITHVIRGEDHVVNTAQQIQIFQALGAGLPTFAHMPMMLDKDGHKMSKRLGALSIEDLRNQGFVPQAILSYMAGLGFSETAPTEGVEALATWFELEKTGRAPVRFDEDQLVRTNTNILHKLELAEIKPYLANFLQKETLERDRLEAFWLAARENIETLTDLAALETIGFASPTTPDLSEADKDYIKTALNHLPTTPYTKESWKAWTSELKQETGRKGKDLFMPLRLALTGESHGPDMANLFPVIGEESARQRLKSCCS